MGLLFTKPWFIFDCCSPRDNEHIETNDKEEHNQDLSTSFLSNTTSESNLSTLSSSDSDCPRILSVDDLKYLVILKKNN